ncbi:MAG TPA: hypothetical protein PK156_50465 [Polyangium sp.]|nr:hypothetical protein [Polyangium sp.]
MEQSKTEAQAQNNGESATQKRSPLIYAVPAMLAVAAGAYVMLRPPSPGSFCSAATGCYEVDFGSGQSDGTIAFYLPGGARSRVFPLVRESSGVYTTTFIGNERIRLVLQDRDHLVRDDNAVYARTPLDQVQRHLDAVLDTAREKREVEKAEAGAELARRIAEEQMKAQQAKIDSLLSQLTSAQDEETRSKIAKQLEEEKGKQMKMVKPPASKEPQKPCNCAPNDPLCSCL